jgi:hypothetical protein
MIPAYWTARLESILVRRNSVLQRALVRVLRVARPGVIETRQARLDDFATKRRVSLAAPSDTDPDLFRRLQWGDHWVKYELTKALGTLGYVVTDLQPDVVIHLFGTPAHLPRRAVKILWHYSHPERMSPGLLARYDRIFCASETFAEKIRSWGFAAETLWPGSSQQPAVRPVIYDVVFVGNARPDGRRRVVDDLGHPDYRFRVWGHGYRALPHRYWAGEHVVQPCVADVYAASVVSLSDHHASMTAEGFLNPRVFDILASGGFCISDTNPALTTVFGDAIPQYSAAADLRDLVDFFLRHPEEREPLMERGRRVTAAHTWLGVARRLLHGLEPAWDAGTGARTKK